MFAKLMNLLGRQPKRDLYEELHIQLFERQEAAREALGAKYICHPSRDVQRIKRPSIGSGMLAEALTQMEPATPAKLYLVK